MSAWQIDADYGPLSEKVNWWVHAGPDCQDDTLYFSVARVQEISTHFR